MDVLLAHQRAVEDDSKYIRSSFHDLDPQLRSVLHTTLLHAAPGDASAPGPLALVVCAAPAQLHDTLERLKRCTRNHRDTGGGFPLRFAACSSQDRQEVHERLRRDPPPLLLTDAATLDQWLMGWMGTKLRDRLRSGLRVLACVGEAPDGSRLQATELALLVRRLRAQCRHAQTCIGCPEPPVPLHPEPLLTHLYALAFSEMALPDALRCGDGWPSLAALVDEAQSGLSLRPELRAALRLGPEMRERLHAAFEQTLHELQSHADRFDPDWAAHALDALPQRLDQALDRWRALYRAARGTLEHATYKIQSDLLPSRGRAFLDQQRRQAEGRRQLQWLCHAGSGAEAGPDFHPARFLAAEGLLPGHGVTRHPLRLFLSSAQDQGRFVSYPRALALREHGPLAPVHHEGRRYRVTRIVLPDADSALTAAKLCRRCGCLLEGGQRQRESCPVCGASLSDPGVGDTLHDLLEAADAYAEEVDAGGPVDEPSACGFDIHTCVSLDGAGVLRPARLKAGSQTLLELKFIPDARLVQLNRGWRDSEEEGFPLDLLSGAWCRAEPQAPSAQPRRLRRVALRTSWRADVLLLLPAALPGLDAESLAVLWQALLRAIEQRFPLEAGALGVASVGQGERPGLLLHEPDAGGQGLLSRLMEGDTFLAVTSQAQALCRGIKAGATGPGRDGEPADQRTDTDRPIDDALDRLCHAVLERPAAAAQEDYDTRYARLLAQLDPASAASRRFLDHLHAHRLRLPDAVRRRVPGLYLRPDFHIEPRTWVFCDGASPEALTAAEEHAALREELLARGDEVWAWHAAEDLKAKVAQRPDLFPPAR